MKTLSLLLAALVGVLVVVSRVHGSILAIVLTPEDLGWVDRRALLTQPNLATNQVSDPEQSNLATNQVSDPEPPYDNPAKMARYIVHYSMWGTLAHISTEKGIEGSPIARGYSISDGAFKQSTGIPYFYLTRRDPEVDDLEKDGRATLALSLAQTPYCKSKELDPEDPRCAQVILTGKIDVLKNDTADWKTAEEAMFSRHPVMKKWPAAHNWVFCKLNIKRILVVRHLGGNDYPEVEDYFKATPDITSKENPMLDTVFY